MSSYRIRVNEIDRSQTLIPDLGNTGAIVVRADRGPSEPALISVGQEQRIIDLFGDPTATQPDVVEAIEFNRFAPVWMLTPSDPSSDKHCAVVVNADNVYGYKGEEDYQEPTGMSPTDISGYSFGNDDEYFILYCKFPSKDDFLKVNVELDGITGVFHITLYIKRDGHFEELQTYSVSLTPGAKGDYGENIYIEDVFEDDPFIGVIVNDEADLENGFAPGGESGLAEVELTGSAKTSDQASLLTGAWNKFQSARKYPAKIFIDATADPVIPAVFDALRSTYQKYSSFILPLPLNDGVSAAQTTYQGYSLNNRGISVYWNQGLVRYKNRKFWSTLTGRVGRKYAQMVNVYNGLAPAWIDENNHGGQLGPGVLEMKFDPTENELEILDKAGINPIIFHPVYGVMVTSQKTAKTPGFISDDSFVGHSRLFDTIIENIAEQVLVPQITKLNDDIHRRRAIAIADSFLRPMSDPSLGLLNAYKIKCDLSNNDATARAQKKFVFSLAVQVTPFSETIEFNFIKTGQSITVDSVLA